MSECRSCGAEIEFVETKNGKQMPLDVAESPCSRCNVDGLGGEEAESDTADWADCVTCGGKGWLRLSHFATCPTAARHRKAKA